MKKSFDKKSFDGKKKGFKPRRKDKPSPTAKRAADGKVRLNRYLAHSGICSRREADVLIQSGVVRVNGEVVTEMGMRVDPKVDKIKYGDDSVNPQKSRYILLNKPKGFVMTSNSVNKKNTVFNLIQNACIESVMPVDKMDRNSTGLLLFTNDTELSKKLANAYSKIEKTYIIETDKAIKKEHLKEMISGFEKDNEFVKLESAEFLPDPNQKKMVMITILNAKCRIIRKIFENYGYNVTKIDRIKYGELNKKTLLRGKWRHLTEKEVGFLKLTNS